MKNIPILMLMLFFASCVKSDIKISEIIQVKKPEICNFGELSYSAERRHFPKKPPKNNQPPTQPSDSGVLFLDFDGHTVVGTIWNYNGQAIECGPAGLSSEQEELIVNETKSHYAGKKIKVSTDSTHYWAAPVNKRSRCIYTQDHAWYEVNNPPAGGSAYRNSFIWGDNTPCFVFTLRLNFNTSNIARAGSHEFGHTLGCVHHALWLNCILQSHYDNTPYPGTTIGRIMGLPYGHPSVAFGSGKTPYSCTDEQCDWCIMERNL